jgi:hypothetical protein
MTGLGVFAVMAAGIAASATALERLPVLSLEVAEKAASACREVAAQKAWRMNIAVVDGSKQFQ